MSFRAGSLGSDDRKWHHLWTCSKDSALISAGPLQVDDRPGGRRGNAGGAARRQVVPVVIELHRMGQAVVEETYSVNLVWKVEYYKLGAGRRRRVDPLKIGEELSGDARIGAPG